MIVVDLVMAPAATIRCRAHQLSREIEELSGEIPKHITGSVLARIVAKAREAGADIYAWLRTRSLCIVFASFTEAKFLGVPVLDVWNGYSAETDRRDLARTAQWGGLDDEATNALTNEAFARASELIESPDVWRAVLAVADAIPNNGRLEGREIAAIVGRHCPFA